MLHDQIVQALPPLCTREKWAELTGLSVPTVKSGADRGFWPILHVGKRVFINVEAVRLAAIKKAEEFTL
jgi:hypothetical protein